MPISFIPEEEKKKKRPLEIPFLVWWISIPLLVLGVVFFFIFQEIPESEIVVDAQDIGIDIGMLKKIEENLKIFDNKLLKELEENPFPKIPKVPSEKVGRSNPFGELEKTSD